VRLKPGTACASHDPAGEEFAEFLSLTAGAQSGHRRSGDFALTDSRFANEIELPVLLRQRFTARLVVVPLTGWSQ